MAYKYLETSPNINTDINDIFIDDFQEMLDSEFSAASDVYDILEETSFASGSYVSTTVRINEAVAAETGLKLGDDFKRVLFKEASHTVEQGLKYYFNDNYWVTTNTMELKNLAIACTIRRCNNVLRWVNTNGQSYEEPCAIEYVINRSIDSLATKDPTTPEGYIKIYCQENTNTKKIKVGQRFLFGNTNHWTAFKVFGNGLNSFLNKLTYDNNSSQLLTIQMGANFVNDNTDDLVNGIADKYDNTFTVTPYPTSISGSIGKTFQINPNVEINDIAVTKTMLYASSDKTIATVTGSGGAVSLIGNGSTTIGMHMVDNTSASANVTVTVSASSVPNYDIRVSPSDRFVLEGDTTTFTVYGYNGGVLSLDEFVFSITGSGVPPANYLLTTVDENSFTLQNIEKYLTGSLVITSTSGLNAKSIGLSLKAMW